MQNFIKIIIKIISIACCALNTTAILADKPAGGIQFLKYPNLEIYRQDVTISLEQITINYVLVNNSSLDLIETMVFPMPKPSYDKLYLKDEEHLQNFAVLVNDRQVDYKIVKRAITSQGEDITEYLKNSSISASPMEAMNQLNQNVALASLKKTLQQKGLIDPTTNTAKWFTKTYFHWQQKFPPAKEIHLRQTYKPNVKLHRHPIAALNKSQSAAVEQETFNLTTWIEQHVANQTKTSPTPLIHSNELARFTNSLENLAPHLQQYCPKHADYKLLIQKLYAKSDHQQRLISREINFNLSYDDNWSAPIKHFTLKIEHPKGTKPFLCWSAPLQKIGKHTLLFEAQNYVPLQDVNLLLVTYPVVNGN